MSSAMRSPVPYDGGVLILKHTTNVLCTILAALLLVQAMVLPAMAAENTLTLGGTTTGIQSAMDFVGAVEEKMPENSSAAAPSEPAETEPAAVLGEAYTVKAKEEREIPQYFQNDYPNTRYGTGNVATQGCSITSLAMVATYLTGHEYFPDELAGYFGGKADNNVLRLEYANDALRLPYTKTYDWRDVRAALEDGDIAIILVNGRSGFTNSQHFLVLEGFNDAGKVIVHDSNKDNYERWNLKNGFEAGFDPSAVIRGFSGAWIYHVDQVPEDPFIYVEKKPNATYRYPEIELTWAEMELLARVVWVEARGESFEGQQAVAEVVFNRMVSEDYPNTLAEVIYQNEQFRSVPLLEKAQPSQTQYEAIEAALEGPNVLPKEVFYFASYKTNPYVWGEIGNHIFCYAEP